MGRYSPGVLSGGHLPFLLCSTILYAADSLRTFNESRFCSACHKSYWDCWLSQLSGEVSNAIERRIAISGLIPALPLRMEDKVFRLTPRHSAALVTETPSGSRQSSRIISPGCGGLCINIFSPQ